MRDVAIRTITGRRPPSSEIVALPIKVTLMNDFIHLEYVDAGLKGLATKSSRAATDETALECTPQICACFVVQLWGF